DGIRAFHVTGVQTCALPILPDAIRPRLHLEGTRSRDVPLAAFEHHLDFVAVHISEIGHQLPLAGRIVDLCIRMEHAIHHVSIILRASRTQDAIPFFMYQKESEIENSHGIGGRFRAFIHIYMSTARLKVRCSCTYIEQLTS